MNWLRLVVVYMEKVATLLSSVRWRKVINLIVVGSFAMILTIMGLVIWQNREVLLEVFLTAQYGYFIWTFVIYTVASLTVATGWHLVMRDLNSHAYYPVNLKIYFYTLFARRLPGTLWYIAGRAVLYERLGVPKRITSLASGIEVVLSIVSGMLVGAPALFWYLGFSPATVIILVAVELIGLTSLHPKGLRYLLMRMNYPLPEGSLTLYQTLPWIIVYVFMWIGGGLMTGTVIAAIYPIDISLLPLVISLWSLTGVVTFLTFLLPNNLGLAEVTLSILLSQLVPFHIAIAVAILIRILTTGFDLLWSSLFFFEHKVLSRDLF